MLESVFPSITFWEHERSEDPATGFPAAGSMLAGGAPRAPSVTSFLRPMLDFAVP